MRLTVDEMRDLALAIASISNHRDLRTQGIVLDLIEYGGVRQCEFKVEVRLLIVALGDLLSKGGAL